MAKKKSKLIKSRREIDETIELNLYKLSNELNEMVKDNEKPTFEEIVKETRNVRSKL